MAKPKAKPPENDHAELVGKLHFALGEVVTEKINEIIANAGTNNVAKASIAIRINNTDSVPQCFVKLRATKTISTQREFGCTDPNQPEMFTGDDAKENEL